MDTDHKAGSAWSRRIRLMTLTLLAGLSVAALSACTGGEDLSGTAGMMRPRSIGGIVTQHPMGGDARAPGGGNTEVPAPASRVELWKDSDGDGSCDESVDTREADSEGRYEFEEVEEGRYCVGAVAASDLAAVLDFTDLSESFEISASASEGEVVDISLN